MSESSGFFLKGLPLFFFTTGISGVVGATATLCNSDSGSTVAGDSGTSSTFFLGFLTTLKDEMDPNSFDGVASDSEVSS